MAVIARAAATGCNRFIAALSPLSAYGTGWYGFCGTWIGIGTGTNGTVRYVVVIGVVVAVAEAVVVVGAVVVVVGGVVVVVVVVVGVVV
ncbi:hypothetical protein, partial [Mycolicibacterium novocastrense]|uniref:hypothetical protein n=1 Tax=Mycolicibacterium novocastrense TaxID=59813 RepID=UPI001C25B002